MFVLFNVILFVFNRCIYIIIFLVGFLFKSDELFSVKKIIGGLLIGWMWMLMVMWELVGGIFVLDWFFFSRMLIFLFLK